jgi:hypothetical protein
MTKIIHVGGLFPPSFGPARTRCGLLLPMDKNHFGIWGQRSPKGSRQCKRCRVSLKKGYFFRLGQAERNRRISEGLRLAWKRRREAMS